MPGITVVPACPDADFVRGASTLAEGPTASIRVPLTRTAHPSCISLPSKTRARVAHALARLRSQQNRMISYQDISATPDSVIHRPSHLTVGCSSNSPDSQVRFHLHEVHCPRKSCSHPREHLHCAAITLRPITPLVTLIPSYYPELDPPRPSAIPLVVRTIIQPNPIRDHPRKSAARTRHPLKTIGKPKIINPP